MQRKRNKLLVLLLVILLFLTGCSRNDAVKFKKEFEKYNNTLTKIEISKDNPFEYAKDINKLLKEEKAFVVFYGSPTDNESREMVNNIINTAKDSNLKKVYYVEMKEKESYEIAGAKIDKMPSLVGIIRGEINCITIEKDKVNTIIDPVVIELSTCDIEVGC